MVRICHHPTFQNEHLKNLQYTRKRFNMRVFFFLFFCVRSVLVSFNTLRLFGSDIGAGLLVTRKRPTWPWFPPVRLHGGDASLERGDWVDVKMIASATVQAFFCFLSPHIALFPVCGNRGSITAVTDPPRHPGRTTVRNDTRGTHLRKFEVATVL